MSDRPRLSDRTLGFGRRMAGALLGVDACYREESGDPDGFAVVNLAPSGELEPDRFADYGEARAVLAALRQEAATLPEPDRGVYYDQLCHSTLALIDWRERGLPFETQLEDFLHVPAEPVPEAEVDRLSAAIRARLTTLGYRGNLLAQCAAWEDRHRVPAGSVPAALQLALDQAWDATEATLLPIPKPKSDGMRVAPVSGAAFNARCNYLERQIEINTDPVLTGPGLRHLAVHEGSPGHYLQFTLRETLYRQGLAAADGLLSLVNSASSSVFEGIADAGLRMLGWDQDPDMEVQSLLNRHRAAIGTGAAWRLHAEGWTEAQVADWLRSACLTGGEGWVANRMAFIRAPSRAVLIWSYWWGEPTVVAAWDQLPPADRPGFLEYLHGRMHSTTTVAWYRGGPAR